jgi:hypothetical protein
LHLAGFQLDRSARCGIKFAIKYSAKQANASAWPARRVGRPSKRKRRVPGSLDVCFVTLARKIRIAEGQVTIAQQNVVLSGKSFQITSANANL